MNRLCPLFLSHGAPSLALDDGPAHQFLRQLGRELPRPEAILVISAHWSTAAPAVTGGEAPATIHDFYGFPDALYELRYPAPGEPALADEVRGRLAAAGFDCGVDEDRGLDHGAWVPLLLMYPQADIPVVQLSLQTRLDPAHHHAVGRTLAGLSENGILVLGSGGVVHNLGRLGPPGSPAPPWATDFETWVTEHVEAGDADALLDYRTRAPAAATAHPTEEHLLPLFTALGAAGAGARGRPLHRSFDYASLAMSCYAFDAAG